MKTFLKQVAFSFFCVLVLFGGGVEEVEGKNGTVTRSGLPRLNYLYTGTGGVANNSSSIPNGYSCPYSWMCGWGKGLEPGANVDVRYKARLFNHSTGVEINDGASVPMGTRIRIQRDISTLSTDISWNGTGYSVDSPYGRWVPGGGPLPYACHANDYVGTFVEYGADIYILLNINPVVPSVVSPSLNLTFISGDIYEVTAAGAISVGFNFPATYGYFYYRESYPSVPDMCIGNNAKMRIGSPYYAGNPLCAGINCLTTSYTLTVPALTITFNLTGVSSNNPPALPIITHTSPLNPAINQGYTDISQSFSFDATDPDNDPIRYGIDWDMNGSVDQWAQGSSYVPSGTVRTESQQWATPNSKQFQVRTHDDQGGYSDWTTTNITINLPPSPSVITDPATGVSATSMQLNARANPNGSITTGWLRYTNANQGVCNDSFGIRIPSAGGANLGSGSSNQSYNQPIVGLTPGDIYYYCAIASSINGTSFGNIVSSQTKPSTPTGLSATPAPACDSTSIGITWNTSAGASSYTLRDGGLPVYTGAATLYTHTGLTSGSNHSYTIQATNGSGNSGISDPPVLATVAGICYTVDIFSETVSPVTGSVFKTGVPKTFIGDAKSGTEDFNQGGWAGVEFDWDSDGGVQMDGGPGYDIFFDANSGLQLGIFNANQTKPLSYFYSNLPLGNHQYRFNVDVLNSLVESDDTNNRSAWKSFKVIDGTLTVNPLSVISGGTTILSWSTVGSPTICTVSGTNGDSFTGTSNLGVASSALVVDTAYTLTCDGVLLDSEDVIIATYPDLTSGAIDVSVATLIKGDDVTFSSSVTNSGSVSTGVGFSDNFTYRWGGVGSWQPLNVIDYTSAFTVGETQTDSSTFSLTNSGTIEIQHCVDAVPIAGVIDEGPNESNCVQQSFTVENPSGNIISIGCIILDGNSTCNIALTWNGTYTLPIRSITRGGAAVISGIAEDSGTTDNGLTAGTYTYRYIHNGSSPLGLVTVSAACAPPAIPNVGAGMSGNCEEPPPAPIISILAAPDLIRSGETAEVDIIITSTEDLTCKLYGATTISPMTLTHIGNATPQAQSTITTKELTNAQIVLVTCIVDSFPVVTSSSEERIEVVPTIEEV